MSALKSLATALFLALWAGAAVFALAGLASQGVDGANARITPGGILYVTRSTAVLYGIAALPLALLITYRLASARLHPAAPLAAGLLLTGAVAAFYWSQRSGGTGETSVNLADPRSGPSESRQEAMARILSTKILFYGQVVDQHGNPVEDATVE